MIFFSAPAFCLQPVTWSQVWNFPLVALYWCSKIFTLQSILVEHKDVQLYLLCRVAVRANETLFLNVPLAQSVAETGIW